MNIGIVTTWYESGAAYVSKSFEKALSTKNNVYIYARGGDSYAVGDENWDRENVTWAKKISLPITTGIDIKHFKKWLGANNIDTVIFNEQHWWIPVVVCHEMGVKTGAYIDYYTEETIPLFGCYDFLICNTLRHYETFKWHPQAYYIPWGTDTGLFSYAGGESRNDGNFITFFHSAGMNPLRKGTDLLLSAFGKVSENARLVIHTQRNLKQYFPKLAGLIDSLANDGKLTIIEKSVTAPGLYSMGDVYVYPSRLDGIGLTVAEALACGLPVIASDNAPMNEFVNDITGKLVKISRYYSRSDGYYWPQCECSIDDLAEKMKFYIQNKDKLNEFKNNARNYAVAHLDWSKNSSGLGELIYKAEFLGNEAKKESIGLVMAYEAKKMRTVYMLKIFKIFGFMDAIIKKIKAAAMRKHV